MEFLNDVSPHVLMLLGRYLGAGIALGLGGIGAAIGMGIAAGQANEGIMRQPTCQGEMLRTMLIGQAVGSSPSIFALVIGLLIMFLPAAEPELVGWSYTFTLIGAGISIGFGAFGSGWGCGWPAGAACDGLARNPRRISGVTQGMIIGQAVAQSPSIFATVTSLIMLFIFWRPGTDLGVIGIALGSGLAMGTSALGSGLGSGYTAGGGVEGLSHWPKSHAITIRTMLVAQAVCETPAIFGLLVAFVMLFVTRDAADSVVSFGRMLGAGLAVGLGGIGPGFGSGLAGGSGCVATAAHPRVDSLIMRTMLIGQAVSQSTAIYGLIIALALLYVV